MRLRSIKLCVVLWSVILLGVLPGWANPGESCARADRLVQQATELRHAPGDLQVLSSKERLYLRALALCSQNAQAHNNLGDLYEQLERYAEAISAYQSAVDLRADVATPYFGLGDVYFKTGNYVNAVDWYSRGLELKPDDDVSLAFRRQAMALMTQRVIPHQEIVEVLNPPIVRGPGAPIKITFGADAKRGLIPFDSGQSRIRAGAERQLRELGQALVSPQLRRSVFEIGGHTDSRGHEDSNLKLSIARAKAVKHFLVTHFAIPNDRLTIKGYGEYRVIARGNTAAAHAMNRRVEVIKLTGIQKKGQNGSTEGQIMRPDRLAFTTGFLYQDRQLGQMQPIKSDGATVLYTNRNPYQVFFHPDQSCYVYILQRDAAQKWYVLFPQPGHVRHQNPVQTAREYWLPEFGKGFPLDEVKGTEEIYFLALSHPIPELEAPSPRVTSEVVIPITRTLQTRGLSHVGPLPVESMSKRAPPFTRLVERIVAEGGLARTITFVHK